MFIFCNIIDFWVFIVPTPPCPLRHWLQSELNRFKNVYYVNNLEAVLRKGKVFWKNSDDLGQNVIQPMFCQISF